MSLVSQNFGIPNDFFLQEGMMVVVGPETSQATPLVCFPFFLPPYPHHPPPLSSFQS